MKRSLAIDLQAIDLMDEELREIREWKHARYNHSRRLHDVLQELQEKTPIIPPIASAQRDVCFIEDEDYLWWSLTEEQILWIDCVESLHDILK